MNHIFLFLMTALGSLGTPTPNPQTESTVDYSITYQVTNTIEGYSYDSRLDVYVDGKKIGESSVKDQKEMNKITVKVPTGQHTLKCVLLAYYKNQWEERTVANEYSYDFVWTTTQNFASKGKVKLYFDIESGVNVNKKPKTVKKK